MLGAHFDSWHGGTGATDNAAGSAVMMEAVRILKALNLPLQAHGADRRSGPARSRGCSARAPRSRSTSAVRDSLKPAAREVLGLLQRRQRHRGDPRRLPAGQRRHRAGLRRLDEAVRRQGGEDPDAAEHRRHRPPVVRRASACPGSSSSRTRSSTTPGPTTPTWTPGTGSSADDMKLNAAVVAAFVYLAANRPDLLPRKGGLTP